MARRLLAAPPVAENQQVRETGMDRTLVGAEIAWLRELRQAKQNNQPAPSLPPEVAFRLRMRGYVAANAHGAYGITIRGQSEPNEHEADRPLSVR